ncbi:MAG: prolyl oligopeptidase family serine peptidase [Anaerolineae bacterium]|nr:prolyl oligopeptidase family serine peptidase [Anaerolineae bacterium]
MKKLQLDDNAAWKRRFRAPRLWSAELAKADPARGLVVSNQSGKNQLYGWEVESGELTQLTERETGISLGWMATDGRAVYYLDDDQGNEIGHYVRVPFSGGSAEDVTPDLPPYSSWGFGVSRQANRIGFTTADAEGFHTYVVDADPDSGALSTPRRLFHSKKLADGPAFSADGALAVVATTERATMQYYNLVVYDADSGERVGELWDGEGTSTGYLMFSPAPVDERLLGTTNRSGRKRPLLWNPRTGERVDFALADLPGEVYPVDWSDDARRILLCHFAEAAQELYVYDLEAGTLGKLDHPNGTYSFYQGKGTFFGPGDEIWAQWQDATHPAQIIALDGNSGEKLRTVLVAGEVPPGQPWQSISFASSDGQAIQGWLAVPEGEGPFPTILHTHGGPEVVMTEVFEPRSQAWLDHGFAILSINYRGSTTFGREFQEKIWGNPGQWEIEDVVAARAWLVSEGIAHPDQVFVTGWSYGGYITLMALGKYPDLWAGGMAGVAITDWAMMYEDSADTLKGYQVALFGGTPAEKAEAYAASSPITYAERVEAPVYIIQGRHDTRTPARPVEAYEARLKALGKAIEVHWFEAGHAGAGVETDIENQERFLQFAKRVLS